MRDSRAPRIINFEIHININHDDDNLGGIWLIQEQIWQPLLAKMLQTTVTDEQRYLKNCLLCARDNDQIKSVLRPTR